MFLILLQRYTFYLNRAIYRGIFLRKVLLERVGAFTRKFFLFLLSLLSLDFVMC